MSIDFSTLQGLTIPDGVVTKITDAAGNVLWALNTASIVLEVAKETATTYAGETSYTDESFILLDIYPKTANSTVNVTYGGLTKTLTFSGTNAQQVFFGTFNGVSDETETPASGTLTIEGDCSGFACSEYQIDAKSTTAYCGCVTAIIDWGRMTTLRSSAFHSCKSLGEVHIPQGCTGIGLGAFALCTNLHTLTIPKSVTTIERPSFGLLQDSTFMGCVKLTDIIVDDENPSFLGEGGALYTKTKKTLLDYPSASGDVIVQDGVVNIGGQAFRECYSIKSITLPNSVTQIGAYAFSYSSVKHVNVPSGVTSFRYSFANALQLESVTFENTSGWYVTETEGGDISTGTAVDVSDPTNNADLVSSTHSGKFWYRS